MKARHLMNMLGAAMAMCLAAGAANAKALVYCLEGSPENFNPAVNTTNTSLDASRHVYDQLVEFERGTTNVVPGLAEYWEFSDGGKTVIFHLRKGVKFGAVKDFTPTRDFNADDVLFSFNRQLKPDHPYHMVTGGKYDYFNDMDMGSIITVDREEGRQHRRHSSLRAERALHGQSRHGFRLDRIGRICRRPDEEGNARADRPGAGRHRPLSASSPTRRIR